MTNRQKHEAEIRYRTTALIQAVRIEKDATHAREQAQDAYEKAVDALLSEVQA